MLRQMMWQSSRSRSSIISGNSGRRAQLHTTVVPMAHVSEPTCPATHLDGVPYPLGCGRHISIDARRGLCASDAPGHHPHRDIAASTGGALPQQWAAAIALQMGGGSSREGAAGGSRANVPCQHAEPAWCAPSMVLPRVATQPTTHLAGVGALGRRP